MGHKSNLSNEKMADISSLFSCSDFTDIGSCFIPENMFAQIRSSWHIPISIALSYLIAIFALKNFMRERRGFHLQGPLVLWNGFLALFSIIGTLKVGSIFITYFPRYQMWRIACQGHELMANREYNQLYFWLWIHLCSKIGEFGDTLFIILRKRPLIFLHWYHHVTVFLFSWVCLEDVNPVSMFFSVVNFFIHALMYSYYFLKALDVKTPSWISQSITILQICQMLFGCYVISLVIFAKLKGENCLVTTKVCIVGTVIFVSYLILFINFFYRAYVAPSRKNDGSRKQKALRKRK